MATLFERTIRKNADFIELMKLSNEIELSVVNWDGSKPYDRPHWISTIWIEGEKYSVTSSISYEESLRLLLIIANNRRKSTNNPVEYHSVLSK